MGVCIGQARQDGSVREIDQAIAGRRFACAKWADADDFASFDHDGLIGERLATANIQKLSSVNMTRLELGSCALPGRQKQRQRK